MHTQVTLGTSNTEHNTNSWPGNTATVTTYATNSDESQQFAWRFGRLDITGSGSMPQLSGFKRHIVLLEGEGLLIMHDGLERTELIDIGDHGILDLAKANEVELIEGPVRLLEIVVRQDLYHSQAFMLGGENNMSSVDAELLVVFGLEGERIHCILEEQEFDLNTEQWIRIDHPPSGDLQCTGGKILALSVQAQAAV